MRGTTNSVKSAVEYSGFHLTNGAKTVEVSKDDQLILVGGHGNNGSGVYLITNPWNSNETVITTIKESEAVPLTFDIVKDGETAQVEVNAEYSWAGNLYVAKNKE